MLSIKNPFSVGPPPRTIISCLFSPTLATLGSVLIILVISCPDPGERLISSRLNETD